MDLQSEMIVFIYLQNIFNEIKQFTNIADKMEMEMEMEMEVEMESKSRIDTNLSGTDNFMNEIILAYVSYITNNLDTDESITEYLISRLKKIITEPEYLIDCLKKMNKKKCIKYVLIAAYITFISICCVKLIFFCE